MAAIVGFVIAAVLALINSWLMGREKVAEGVSLSASRPTPRNGDVLELCPAGHGQAPAENTRQTA